LPSVSRKYQSGETDRIGRISKLGDAMARTALFKAANVMLISAVRFSALKAWAPRVASRRGMNKAKVALARKLAAVMHHRWLDHGVSPGQASHAGRRSLCIAGEAGQAIPEFATRTVQIVDIFFNVFASATKMIYLQPRSRRCLSLD
jgi:Transposase IS116/IS110/IS902 family